MSARPTFEVGLMCITALQDQRTYQNQIYLPCRACNVSALTILFERNHQSFKEFFKSGIGI